MKKWVLLLCTLPMCSVMLATGLELGLSAETPSYTTYSQSTSIGVQIGDSESYQAEFPNVFEDPALAPQDQGDLKFGILAGFLASTLGGEFSDEHDFRANFLFGVYALYAITATFMLMPELFYAGLGSKFSSSSFESTLRLGYIMLPIMLMYAITSQFMVGLGPYFGFLLSAKEKGSGFDDDIKDFISGFDFGVKLGVFYQVSNYLTLGLSYMHGFTNINDNEFSESFEDYNRVIALTACISLTALMAK